MRITVAKLITHPTVTYTQVALLAVAIVVLIWFPVFTYDIYWHMTNGRAMVETGRLVEQEIFSYTAAGTPFHNHEWLSQILFYLVFEQWGATGLHLLKVSLVAIAMGLLYRTARGLGASPAFVALLCLLAVIAGLYRYTVRPHLFSHIGLAALAYILYLYRAQRLSASALWALPPILIVWDWLHGAIYGLLFLGVFVFGEYAKRLGQPLLKGWPGAVAMPAERLRALTLWTGITLALMLLNPWGPLSYDVFVELISGSRFVAQTQEFMPANWAEHKLFWMLLGLTVAALIGARRHLDLTQLLLLLAFAVLAIRYSRAIGAFGLVAVPVIALSVAHLVGPWQEQGAARGIRGTALALVVLGSLLYVGYIKFFTPTPRSFGMGMSDVYLPAGSVRFIQDVDLQGNLYNSGKFGGYLAYFISPERKIFQYNHPSVFTDPHRFVDNPHELDKWNINYAIVGEPKELQKIFPMARWARVYREQAAVVVVRRSPQNRELIEKYAIRYFHPMLSEVRLRRLAGDAYIYPRLIREMATYLAYREDIPMADLFAELLTEHGRGISGGLRRELLRHAQRHNAASNKLKTALQRLVVKD